MNIFVFPIKPTKMNTRNLFFGVILFFGCISINATTNKLKATFTSNAIITDVETSLSFFIPVENKEVYVFVADENKKTFQKIKVYQRGNGIIYCDKTGLTPGTYYYTLSVDGELLDSQKAEIK